MILFLLFIGWTGMIFYFSSQPPERSYSQSGMTVKMLRTVNDLFDITDTHLYGKLEHVLKNTWPFSKYQSTNAVVRKSAHFGMYFLLGMLSAAFGYLYAKKMLIGFLLGVSLPVVIAVLDEFNQEFVGRTSSLNDVIIDGTGALTGTLIIIFLTGVVKIIRSVNRKLRK
ncbi:hypothetical protein DCMF_06550 [Candidatus Formimonas warabiya]|uniref:VanZ-like domain-containing protein n=2 Tax=Formimonas warabiya TaxID=1761012 RepID=A0A3G1L0W2_FORW1|nr:hypothetical protein DCMF_06550 [Candidatus Formimonas warabiya]